MSTLSPNILQVSGCSDDTSHGRAVSSHSRISLRYPRDSPAPPHRACRQLTSIRVTFACLYETPLSKYKERLAAPHMVRARIRANRIPTQYRRYTPLMQVDDPSCTFAACRNIAPFCIDTIQHILLACPRHQAARQQLSQQLLSHLGYTIPLSVALISGELPHLQATKKQQTQRGVALLSLSAAFLTQVMLDREADPTLLPFYSAAAKLSS